ncbi:hypothetical protein BDW71DRAFT_217620 [Aspergillus fruticulosus]
MDFLTIFVLPTVSDYNTRITMLSFHMTWFTLVMSHTALGLDLWGTLLVRLLFFFLPSIEQGEDGLLTGSKRTKLTVKEAKIAGWAVANFALNFFHRANDARRGFFAIEIIHRFILHSKLTVFAYIVKCHKSWYHSLRTPFPLTAHYDHPATYLLSTFLPMYLPALVLRFHMITFLVYTVIISLEETFVFSGYYAMLSFLVVAAARRVDGHLAADGRSYFGRWGIADILAGTGAMRVLC